MKKIKANIGRPFKLIAAIVVIIAIIITAGLIFAQYLKSLSFFTIKEIIVKDNNRIDLSYLKGKNIFNIDLSRESLYAWRMYPVYKRIRLIRVLPNRIYVDFAKRKPMALVKINNRYFAVDEGAIFFDAGLILDARDPGWINLPLILGLGHKIPNPRSGTKYYVSELGVGLRLIRDMTKIRICRDFRLISIDLSNADSLLLQFSLPSLAGSGIVEVKLGREDTGTRIRILAGLLYRFKKDWNSVKYIDLRFKEPVIRFNEISKLKKGD